MPFKGTAPARIGGAFVTFEPGARTAWHTHPLGQTLIVTSGMGWVQMGGRCQGGHPGRRYRLDTVGGKALAWRNGEHRDDAHRHLRGARWQDGRLVGESVGRSVQWLAAVRSDWQILMNDGCDGSMDVSFGSEFADLATPYTRQIRPPIAAETCARSRTDSLAFSAILVLGVWRDILSCSSSWLELDPPVH